MPAPELHCLSCHAEVSVFVLVDEIDYSTPGGARPGDLALCLECGGVMKVDDHGNALRFMSRGEWDAIRADKNFMHIAWQLVAEARAIKRAIRLARDN